MGVESTMNYINLALKTLLIIIATLIGLRITFIFIQRIPGVTISLSVIALGILSVALYKGSFEAIGLKNRQSILYAMIGAAVLFFISLSILMFVDR